MEVTHHGANKTIITSEVSGSGFQTYHQAIILQKHHQNFSLDGECTCPVGHNCKHVVASCLTYLDTIIDDPDTAPSNINGLNWLNHFANAANQEATTSSQEEFLSYLLTLSKKTNNVSVSFIRRKRLKNGGLGKPKSVSIFNINGNYIQPDYVADIDIKISKMVEAQNEQIWHSDDLTLTGNLGYICLKEIIDTGRSHWLSADNPVLKTGEARELKLLWSDEKNGAKKLNIKTMPEAQLLNLYPPLYLDAKTYEAGALTNTNFTEHQWEMLLDMPIIPADICTQFSRQLHISCPDTTLPAPEKIKVHHITEPLEPSLLLYGDAPSLTDPTSHYLRLRYVYGAHEIPVYPLTAVTTVENKNTLITIHRDFKAEEKSVLTLIEEGFVCIENNNDNDELFYLPSNHQQPVNNIEKWETFLQETVPSLEASGWIIEIAPSFQLTFVQADDWNVEIESDNDWFDLRFDMEINGEKIPLLPLIAQTLNDYDIDNLPENIILPLSTANANNHYVKVPSRHIKPIFQTLYELFDSHSKTVGDSLRLSRFDAARLAELEDNCSNELNFHGGKAMRKLGRKLKNFNGIKKVAPPRGLKATLRDYQQQGFNWLQFLREYNFNGILADDMGLGKTVQTLAMILKEKERKRLTKPCLIIAPTSLMSNWRRESEFFTPRLSVLTLQGADRRQHFDDIKNHDIILSTYPLLVRDQEILLTHEFHYLILDEAQVIKNPRAKAARIARDIKTQHRLCLTGTPMENHLGELWALFDFLMPGCLGNQKLFNQSFRKPIEKHNNLEQRQRLVNRVAPFMLRRTKSEVVLELPDKTEIIRTVSLGKAQAALYESIRLSMEKKVREAIKNKGLKRSHITILDALLKLRQTCCDPKLLPLAQASKVKSSAKLEMLMEMLVEMLEEGRRILIFSQFTKMLGIIETELKSNKMSYSKLTGKTIHREKVIDEFKQGKSNIFLISLKAGGVGLNLTEADTVIHYDPWWNPAVENQATDRVHRIGQKKAVFVYKLITENTLEEKIIAMQAKKQALADGIYNEEKSAADSQLTANDLKELFAPLNQVD